MSLYREKRRRDRPRQSGEQAETQRLYQAICRSAATEHAPRTDPVYALSAGFAQVFDLVGRQRAAERMGRETSAPRGADMRPYVRGEEEGFLQRYAAYAFRGGEMAGAILRGRGEMMLFACLRRAGGRGFPQTEARRRLDELADERPAPQSGVRARFNADERSAVAVTMQATAAATRALSGLYRAALLLEGQGVHTLREAFPFLFMEEDRRLVAALSEKRRALPPGSAQGRLVDRALQKARAVLQKKRQMRQEFLTRLERMLSSARAAEALFAAMLREDEPGESAAALPPDEGEPKTSDAGTKAGEAGAKTGSAAAGRSPG